MAIRKYRPMLRLIDAMNPICVLRDHAFEVADGEHNPDNHHIDDERKFLIYGRLWLILLACWDEITGSTDPGGPEFEERLLAAFSADIEDLLTAMY